MAGTLKETPEGSQVTIARLLTVVLHYDDLLTPPAVVAPWGGEALVLGRGDVDAPSPGRLNIADPRVSTDHARLSLGSAGTVLRDLGSSNGTWLNGVRVRGEARLENGDLLELGRSVLVYREARAAEASHVASETGARFGALRTLNPELGEVYRRLQKVAPTRQTVLIVGETGTGKDVVATELHHVSARAGPFVAIDCGAVPDDLFESTMFGHERGTFTGATDARVGELSRANRGTLLLDEVGNLTASAQAKLLRVLETRRVTPLGSSKSQDLDVRWLAATNRFLLDADDGFRSDLLHRLAGVVVTLPALRRRREDLGLLVAELLSRLEVTQASVTPAAGRLLVNHAFGGNIRQLRNVLERAAAERGPLVLDHDALGPLELPAGPLDEGPVHEAPLTSDDESELDRRERGTVPPRSELEAALLAAKGNVTEAARALGTYPRQLYRWFSRAGVDLTKFRGPGADE